MGREPRSFRAAKQSWVASHGRFVPRNSHGLRLTVVSRRETVRGHKPRSFRAAKQSWSRATVVSRRETVMGHEPGPFRAAIESWVASPMKLGPLGRFLQDLRHSRLANTKNRRIFWT